LLAKNNELINSSLKCTQDIEKLLEGRKNIESVFMQNDSPNNDLEGEL
jgi:hypothetical protein